MDWNDDPAVPDSMGPELKQLTVAFGKPVVLVHGDTHVFRVDKGGLADPVPTEPEMEDAWTDVPNFTRVETYAGGAFSARSPRCTRTCGSGPRSTRRARRSSASPANRRRSTPGIIPLPVPFRPFRRAGAERVGRRRQQVRSPPLTRSLHAPSAPGGDFAQRSRDHALLCRHRRPHGHGPFRGQPLRPAQDAPGHR